ncbi:MAG: penicillin-binding transpeptidase domain-containing protein, partial [Defluviitaleaceae bacterium]|nr:penicillin-binding transpeptidase domain-containing protein [Defluviitaleaceae bacterium]
YFVWTALRADFVTSSFNPRINIDMGGLRGNIYDANGVVLATDVDGTRHYPLGVAFAHVVGYSHMSRGGLELVHNFTLTRLHRELTQRTRYAVFDEAPQGNSIQTTIDSDLQVLIHNALGSQRGSVVALDPSTGAILAMVSTPSFNPNQVAENWGSLIEDPSSPLLNRATQGLYPPGSTFKLITTLAALEYNPELAYFTYTCTGVHHFGDETIQCFNATAHGYIGLERAMAVSCNGFFAELATIINSTYITQAAERSALFNQPIPFYLPSSTSRFPMEADADAEELIQTAIGQGRIAATPLSMALLAATIANNGVMMQPYIVSHAISGHNGNTLSTTTPRTISRNAIPTHHADTLANTMVAAVNNGTASPASLPNIQTAGKTGTAEVEAGPSHSWFIGFAPADNPTIAVAIIIENTGGGPAATNLARQIFTHATQGGN